MKPKYLAAYIAAAMLLLQCGMGAPAAHAWTGHPLISYQVCGAVPEVRDAPPASVEEIDAFLMAEEEGLAVLLACEEVWAQQNLAWYQPLPAALVFAAPGDARTIRQRFCHAVRANPGYLFSLYLQLVPGTASGGREVLSPASIMLLHDTADWRETRFVKLAVGERVDALGVLATATDEPDFGMDVGLYEDNGTEFGKLYGFGAQPFGNANLDYGSQAPFHMGFYHEAGIVNMAAPFTAQTYPEYRIHLYQSLSRFAFQTGHDYWGWRFMGMGLHYVCDLGQPYHAAMLPGVGVAKMLGVSLLDMAGIGGPQADAVQLVSNRHMALELFQHGILQQAYRDGADGNPIMAALRTVEECPPWNDMMPRDVISEASSALADETDALLEETMPEQFVSDPGVELGARPERYDIIALIQEKGGSQAVDRLTTHMRDLLRPLPAYMCAYIQSVRGK